MAQIENTLNDSELTQLTQETGGNSAADVASEQPRDTTSLFDELHSLHPKDPQSKEIREKLLKERDDIVTEFRWIARKIRLRHLDTGRYGNKLLREDKFQEAVANNTLVAVNGDEYYFEWLELRDYWGDKPDWILITHSNKEGDTAESVAVSATAGYRDYNDEKVTKEYERAGGKQADLFSYSKRYGQGYKAEVGAMEGKDPVIHPNREVINVVPGVDPFKEARRMIGEMQSATQKSMIAKPLAP